MRPRHSTDGSTLNSFFKPSCCGRSFRELLLERRILKVFLDNIDSRTTFIVVGDGRNNYNDPCLGLFEKLARRSRRTIWLTPEAPFLWGSGDSDMLKYAPRRDVILQEGTLAELSRAVDKLLGY